MAIAPIIVSQQRLHSIEYTQLKNLVSVAISFEPKNITGIFGVNGSGKSTIIHSLLCIYKPSAQETNREDYKFFHFFTPTTHAKWDGSKFKINHSFRIAAIENPNQEREYKKSKDRWNPRYENRPERDVYFISVKSCVPEIEIETSKSLITLTQSDFSETVAGEIKQKAAHILNKNYQEYNQQNVNSKNKKLIGVKCNDIVYSSLSMGAGEQRVFKILETVFKARKYSLIIIDEIDLLLHTEALNKLITVLNNRANEKDLQIIFTSHREELTKRMDINIRHIHQAPNKTICFDQTTPDSIIRLTGNRIRTLELFVEDDLAETIVTKIVEDLNILRHCSIKRFGAIDNSFTLAAGLLLKGESLDNICIVLDGDKYNTEQERLSQIAKIFSGTESTALQKRKAAISCIRNFTIPPQSSPEHYINNSIIALNDNSEIVNAAISINAVLDNHEYVNQIINQLGYQDKSIGLIKIVNKLASTPIWNDYTEQVRKWLEDRIQVLHLN